MIFIYSLSFIYHFTGLFGNQHNDQLPVALLVQFVKRHWFKSRIGINFFGPYFTSVSIVFISAKIASIFVTVTMLLTVSELSNLR